MTNHGVTEKKFKRLFFDIETSPNIVFSWNVGRKINIDYDNIITERAIICICYKYEGQKHTHSLMWDKGNDKPMLSKFAEVMNEADEIIGHNSDNFDIKWVRTRCLIHKIPLSAYITSIDTLKASRSQFRFNSNRLDYIGHYLGKGRKLHTGFDLWKKIVIDNDEAAMNKMVDYCKQDVRLLEDIFEDMKPYMKHKTHIASHFSRPVVDCPECMSKNTAINKTRTTAAGVKRATMQCGDCGKYFTLSSAAFGNGMVQRGLESRP